MTSPQRVLAYLRLLLLPGIVAMVAFLGIPVSAFAAYAPGTATVAAPPGAFPTVLTSQTVGAAGAAIRLTSGSATLDLVVPAGAFTSPVQLTVYKVSPGVMQSQLPAGYVLVDGFAVGWSPPTPAAVPLTFTISEPSITASTRVYETTSSGLVPFPGASVVAGSVTVSFTDDPGVIIAQGPGSPAQVAQAPTGTMPTTTQVAQTPAQLVPSTTTSVMPTQFPNTGAGGTAGSTVTALPGMGLLLLCLLATAIGGVAATRLQPVAQRR